MQEANLDEIIESTNAMLNRKGLDMDFFSKLGITPISVAGVRGYTTPMNSEHVNHVGLVQLTEKNADATIEKIIDIYSKQGKSFSWVIGPSTKPKDLNVRLVNHGFFPMPYTTEVGMVMSTKDGINHNVAGFSVDVASLDQVRQNISVIKECWGDLMDESSAATVV